MFTGFTIANNLLYCILVVVHSLLTRHVAYAGSCSQKSDCSCSDEDGREVDLWPLVQDLPDDKPWFPYAKGGADYWYAFNPCTPFSDGASVNNGCANVSICQRPSSESTHEVIAKVSEARFSGDVNSLQIHYSHSELSDSNSCTRYSTVFLHCDSELQGPGNFTVVDDDHPVCYYKFQLRSRYACPKGGQSRRLSIGSIILIVFFVSLTMYFLIGFLVQRYVRNAQGVEMIPNLEFWSALPALTKDGCLFSFHTLKKCSGRSDGYQKI